MTYSGKMVILRNARNTISAARIQATWRSFQVEREASVERAEAKLNKIMNSDRELGLTASAPANICLPLAPRVPRISFNMDELAQYSSGTRIRLPAEKNDAMKKSSCLFTFVMNSWLNYSGNHETFFDGFAKKWVSDPSSEHWPNYLKTVIKLLEDREVVRLWGWTGGTVKIYPLKQAKVIEFQKHLERHFSEKKLELLQGEYKKMALRGAGISSLNPNAASFTPIDVSGSGYWGPGEILDDIDARFQRLMNTHQPVCTVTPLY